MAGPVYATMQVEEVPELEAHSAPGAHGQPPLRAGGARRAVLLGLACAGVGVVALAAWPRSSARHAQRADVGAAQEKTLAAAVGDIGTAIKSGQTVATAVQEALPDLEKGMKATMSMPEKVKEELTKMSWQDPAAQVDLKAMKSLDYNDLMKPDNANRHDGNECPDDEEMHLGLCYKKCSVLTNGVYPIRTTAWSCCHEEPCSFFNSKSVDTFVPCHGYDVAGGNEGKGCPHPAGACMENEELTLGVCYKKCAVLTENEFPFRSAADTCCKYQSHIACLDAANTKTDQTYSEGGGLGDGHKKSPGEAHLPLPELTETAQ